MIEEMIARAKAAEYNHTRPGDRFVAEYNEMKFTQRMEARIREAKKQVEVAAARVMPAR